MKNILLILITISLFACSNDDDIIVTQDKFPLEEYRYNDPEYSNSSIFFFPKNSSRYVEGKLMGQTEIRGLKGAMSIPIEGFVNDNILTIESTAFILRFKFNEYFDRYELTYHEAMIKSGAPNGFTLAYLYNMVFIQYKK